MTPSTDSFERAWVRLTARLREIHLLDAAQDLLAWDREVYMPARGIAQRAEALALLARLSHERFVAPALADELGTCHALADTLAPEDTRRDELRELARRHARRQKLPVSLVAEAAHVEAMAQSAWATARAANDFASFAPWLARVFELARAKAAAFGKPRDGELWDALVEDYEPGASARQLRALFGELVPRQSALVRRLVAAERRPDDAARRVAVPLAAQEALAREVASALGFDFERGRLDRSAHPFTSGTHADDVRITTRYSESDLFDALYSTIHEVGHGLYEQGLPAARAGMPAGQAASLGIHESQSRLWENHVGRSRGFWDWCAPRLRHHAGSRDARHDAVALARAAWRVQPSLIRVDADEATYDLHVAVRFSIEVELLEGRLPIDALPTRWNAAYREILGVEVQDDRRGCLQDVHWSAGLIGYFPTYTLGNLAAAQLMVAARRELGDLDSAFGRGEFRPLLEWLRRHIHAHGAVRSPQRLIRDATGAPLGTAAFLEHLESRLLPAHGLART
ncbi:MAG: carboxypeptidase M32 [Planctomycetes bacterium]|nr:carboxypeptidase M32 [Planctomycetota bacterium]